jgi:hypothetical protein
MTNAKNNTENTADKRFAADSDFTDNWMAKAFATEQEELRAEANLNNALIRHDRHRMEDHRGSRVTFSDAEVAEITSPR